MAKQIIIIDDETAQLQNYKTVFDVALSGQAIDSGDAVHFIYAHEDSKERKTAISNFPNSHKCENFGELTLTLNTLKGPKLILLDVNLKGVHDFSEEGFELSRENLSFYAGIVNDNVDSCILIYSSGYRPDINRKKLIQIGAREQSVASIETAPRDFNGAQTVVLAGLDLFFHNPLKGDPVRLKLQELHYGDCSEENFIEWFQAFNVGRRYPDGTLRWLLSDWVRNHITEHEIS